MDDEEEHEHLEGSYDSELEEEFFGKKDKDLNLKLNNRKGQEEPATFNKEDFKDQLVDEDVNKALRTQYKVLKPTDGV